VEEVKHLFRPATVLFRARGLHKKIIIPPIERYIRSKCCSDIRHMTNFTTDFLSQVADRLTAIRRALADHMHSCRVPNYKVVSAYSLLGLREEGMEALLGALWDKDLVHLNTVGYAIMVESLMDYMVEETSTFCNKPKVKEQRQEVVRSA